MRDFRNRYALCAIRNDDSVYTIPDNPGYNFSGILSEMRTYLTDIFPNIFYMGHGSKGGKVSKARLKKGWINKNPNHNKKKGKRK